MCIFLVIIQFLLYGFVTNRRMNAFDMIKSPPGDREKWTKFSAGQWNFNGITWKVYSVNMKSSAFLQSNRYAARSASAFTVDVRLFFSHFFSFIVYIYLAFSHCIVVIVKSIKNFIWHKSLNWSLSPLGNASFISFLVLTLYFMIRRKRNNNQTKRR